MGNISQSGMYNLKISTEMYWLLLIKQALRLASASKPGLSRAPTVLMAERNAASTRVTVVQLRVTATCPWDGSHPDAQERRKPLLLLAFWNSRLSPFDLGRKSTLTDTGTGYWSRKTCLATLIWRRRTGSSEPRAFTRQGDRLRAFCSGLGQR